MVDRFDCVGHDGYMDTYPDGFYVEYDDYEALSLKYESLLMASREVLKEVVAGTEWESMALSGLFDEVEKAND